ncbi:MAG: SIS domain-containing protein, partial [Candidatus Odinarchaeota archaeon]
MSTSDYIWLEIQEQPGLMHELNKSQESIRKSIEGLLDNKRINKIVMTGSGDSFCVSISAEQAFRDYTGLQCSGIWPMDITRYNRVKFDEKTLLIPISVSGRTPRVIEAVHKAKAACSTVLAVTDNSTSPLSSLADETVLIGASPHETLLTSSYTSDDASKYVGYHHDVAQTKTYSQGLLALTWIALSIGEITGNMDRQMISKKIGWLRKLPEMVTNVLKYEKEIQLIAEKIYKAPYFIFSGSGPNYGTACYSAFKNYEFSIPALYNDLEEYCHTQYFITERDDTPVIFIAEGESLERASEIVPIIDNTIKAPSLTITSEKQLRFKCNSFKVPF